MHSKKTSRELSGTRRFNQSWFGMLWFGFAWYSVCVLSISTTMQNIGLLDLKMTYK